MNRSATPGGFGGFYSAILSRWPPTDHAVGWVRPTQRRISCPPEMKLPSPAATLAGCVFLPRIIAKARAIKTGVLPEEYAVRFGAPDSIDGLFLAFFDLST